MNIILGDAQVISITKESDPDYLLHVYTNVEDKFVRKHNCSIELKYHEIDGQLITLNLKGKIKELDGGVSVNLKDFSKMTDLMERVEGGNRA